MEISDLLTLYCGHLLSLFTSCTMYFDRDLSFCCSTHSSVDGCDFIGSSCAKYAFSMFGVYKFYSDKE